ncbi:hypothetical protein BU26DRAFT_423195 [Trematosphaeria pertusa]|uniref:Copper-fist domain-containing protein n=1 Tax=Trematosphaeria pertusa TaxID=390896 RepID=A0A6A6INV0_9PLEO|nr:uncharacterized protein BU26DRAFT_423195 [Trematosphaeria pertusa]KAF2251173.1 hypothetical protein BU26DRAFT_423195 [Trematosphaeria pertusa]
MWADINGERKKVACCERVVINYTIPKASECACPSERNQPVLLANTSGRVQKNRTRKATNALNPAVIEKAIKAAQDGETDSSSLLTRTPTSESNDASPPSSASSTPRLLPSRKASHGSETTPTDNALSTSRPATSHSQESSSCCKPKPVQSQGGGCCSNKTNEQPKPAQSKKSCCSGSTSAQPTQPQLAQPNGAQRSHGQFGPHFGEYPGQLQHPQYGMMNQGNNYMPMPPPFNFNTPIYNHMASVYQPPASIPMPSLNNHGATHAPEHNCHCGDSCSCFGCAAHPNNATMIEYMRSMHHFMTHGAWGQLPPPTYDMPSYPHHPGFSADGGLAYNSTAPANFLPTNQMNFQANMNGTMSMPSTPLTVTGAWAQTPLQNSTQVPPSLDAQYFAAGNIAPVTTQEATSSLKMEEAAQSPTFADSPSDGKDEETPTLSPSSYFWGEIELPGCNDATGTCQCGDGCECVGCLTHGGHNGIPLESSSAAEEESFPNFVSSNDANGNRSSQFLAFSNAPT